MPLSPTQGTGFLPLCPTDISPKNRGEVGWWLNVGFVVLQVKLLLPGYFSFIVRSHCPAPLKTGEKLVGG